eukprot:scaffold1682_cov154-Skeletonema_marinoi.AAC.12
MDGLAHGQDGVAGSSTYGDNQRVGCLVNWDLIYVLLKSDEENYLRDYFPASKDIHHNSAIAAPTQTN